MTFLAFWETRGFLKKKIEGKLKFSGETFLQEIKYILHKKNWHFEWNRRNDDICVMFLYRAYISYLNMCHTIHCIYKKYFVSKLKNFIYNPSFLIMLLQFF